MGRDRAQERGGRGREKPFLRVQACSWSASRSSPLPSSCRALSLGLVSSTASEEENKTGGGDESQYFVSSVHIFLLFRPFCKSFKIKRDYCYLSNVISKFRRVYLQKVA